MKLFSTLLAFISTITLWAQDVSFQWARSIGSEANDQGHNIVTDKAGNVFVLGDFAGTADFDPGPGNTILTTNGHFDIFISKYDAGGNFIWVKRFGANWLDQARSLEIDSAGDIYFGGTFGSTVDFDPGPGVYNLSASSATTGSNFICKLDNNGNFLWAHEFEDNSIVSLAVSPAGEVYATGAFNATADFDPGPGTSILTPSGFTGSNTKSDIYVMKLTAAGQFVWVKQLGGTENELPSSICLDRLGNIVIGGEFLGTADFDPGPATFNLTATSTASLFVVKLAGIGDFLWANAIHGTNIKGLKALATDPSNSVLVAGYFYGVIDADPGAGTNNLTANAFNRDGFILKLNESGTFQWAMNFGGTQEDIAMDIAADSLGNVYTVGDFRGTVDFNPGPAVSNMSSIGVEDIFILKLTSTGSFLWAKKMGAQFYINYVFALHLDSSRNIYTTGHYWGQVDFDPEAGVHYLNMVSTGDFYIQKLAQCQNVTTSTLTAFACDTFKLNNISYTASGTYTQAIRNAEGCDSIITLNLLIGKKTTTQNASACNTYTWNGSVYQASGSYWDTLSTTSGCDSIVNLLLTIKMPVNNIINAVICEGQARDGYVVSGSYIDTFPAANGCDSVRTLNLAVVPRKRTSVSMTICEGEVYFGYAAGGHYIDTLLSGSGCDSIRTLNLTVLPKKHTTIDTSICQGQAIFLAGGNQVASGVYRDTFQSVTGCDSIVVSILRVEPAPVFELGRDRSFCNGDSIVLDLAIPGNYLWNDLSTRPGRVIKDTGLFWLGVTAVNGCTYFDSIRITSKFQPPKGFLEQLDSLCRFGTMRLQSKQSFRSYLWSTGSTEASISTTTAGKYHLAVMDANGCTGFDSVLVVERDCLTQIHIPSAFTPNGDGRNDLLKPGVTGVVKDFSFSVYNRWGQLVFKSHDGHKGWDGKVNGVIQLNATFVWVCDYTDNFGHRKFLKGVCTLIN